MIADAIKHSVGVQLRALYDSAEVRVDTAPGNWGHVEVTCDVIHRRQRYGYRECFPLDYFRDPGGKFYDQYVREEFPRVVARGVTDMVMKAAL
jgi:hypothetical protein